jgi:hypothetical protein
VAAKKNWDDRMIKSLKSKVQSLKSIINVGLLFIVVLFMAGCVTTGGYVYQDKDKGKRIKEKVEIKKNISQDIEKKENWIESFFEKNNFIMQCPVCMRRYPDNVEKCPYDGAKLERINKGNPKF